MKRLFFFLAASALLYTSCGSSSDKGNMESNDSKGINIAPSALATNIDPVCEMDMSNRKIADTTTLNGKIYAFCNTGCKEEFRAHPEKYLK